MLQCPRIDDGTWSVVVVAGSGQLSAESAFCAMLDSYMVYETSSLLFFLLPMLVMVAIYGRIGSKIRSRGRHSLGKRLEGAVHGETKHTQSRKAIIRMLSKAPANKKSIKMYSGENSQVLL